MFQTCEYINAYNNVTTALPSRLNVDLLTVSPFFFACNDKKTITSGSMSRL